MAFDSGAAYDSASVGDSFASPLAGQSTVEQVKSDIRMLAAEMAQLASARLEPGEFWEAFLPRLCTAVAASGAAAWSTDLDGSCSLVAQLELPSVLYNGVSPSEAHAAILRAVAAEGRPVLVPPRCSTDTSGTRLQNPLSQTLLVAPYRVDDRIDGVLEVVMPHTGGPTAQKGYLRFMAQMSEIVADFLRRHRLRQWECRVEEFAHTENLLLELAQAADFDRACRRAIDGFCLLTAADNAAVLRLGSRRPLLAVRGTPTPDPRSELALQLRNLLRRWKRMNRFPEPGKVVLLPTRERRVGPVEQGRTSANAVGAESAVASQASTLRQLDESLLTEAVEAVATSLHCRGLLFYRTKTEDDIAFLLGYKLLDDAQEMVAQHADERSPAENRPWSIAESIARLLVAQQQYHQRSVGGIRLWRRPEGLGATSSSRVRALVGVALLAAIAAFPIPDQLTAIGTMRAAAKVPYYAPRAATVQQVVVRSGDEVQPGTLLLQLQSRELDRQIAAVQGQIEVQTRRLQTARAWHRRASELSDAEVDQLEGEIYQLEGDVAALQQQLQLLLEQRDELEIRAIAPGQVLTWRMVERLTNRPVGSGELLLETFAPDQGWHVEFTIADRQAGRIRQALAQHGEGLACQIVLNSQPDRIREGRLVNVAAEAIHLQSDAPDFQAVVPAVAQITDDALPVQEEGAVARVVVECGHQPLVWLVCRDAFWAVSSWIRMLW
ncbi:MAG: hypothetical protein KatS3mg111_3377 [Pirellulaceae bacterium]|nr:MAG: hypothetical protein KatS3mg111_3377 [Pirellulaceae bacterium]